MILAHNGGSFPSTTGSQQQSDTFWLSFKVAVNYGAVDVGWRGFIPILCELHTCKVTKTLTYTCNPKTNIYMLS